MDEQLNDIVMARALVFAEANRIAQVGDIVETTWGAWKKPRRVRITKIGATLIADWSKDRGFFIDFEMTYVAHRIRKDGSSLERDGCGICLGNLKTEDGCEWIDRCRKVERPNNARWFNHTALSWRLGENPSPQPNVWGEAKAEDCVLSIGSQRVCAHGTLGCVNHHAQTPTTNVEAEIARVVQSVNEWDDRTSPDDYPEHLLITSEELADILRNFAATLEASDNG